MAGGCHIAAGESRLEVDMTEDTADMGLEPEVAEGWACSGSLAQKACDPAEAPAQEGIGAVVLMSLEIC